MGKTKRNHTRATYCMGIFSLAKLMGLKTMPELEGLTDTEVRKVFRRISKEWVAAGCPDE